jgi:hypothetical protein
MLLVLVVVVVLVLLVVGCVFVAVLVLMVAELQEGVQMCVQGVVLVQPQLLQ